MGPLVDVSLTLLHLAYALLGFVLTFVKGCRAEMLEKKLVRVIVGWDENVKMNLLGLVSNGYWLKLTRAT